MRRRGGQPISLFAFQDIITAVTGIFLLVTITLALALINSRQAADGSSEESIEALQSQVDRLAAETANSRSQLARLQKTSLELAQLTPTETSRRLAAATSEVETLRARVAALRAQASEAVAEHQSAVEAAKDQHQSLNAEVAQVESEIKSATQELAKLKSSQRLFYNARDVDAKRPWLVQVSKGVIETAASDAASQTSSFSSISAFEDWATGRDRFSEYFVLFVRPSGIARYQGLHAQLRRQGFDVGIDLLAEEASVIGLP